MTALEALNTYTALLSNDLDRYTVASLAKQIANYGPVWLEEPLPPDDHEAYRKLKALGILPIGPRALYVPMLTRDVVDTTVAVLDGVPPIEVRGGRLGLTPSRPWMLVQ